MGATVHLHYCMNKFVGISLQDNKEDACSNCGMKARSKNKCCKNEHKQLKLTTAHYNAGITECTQSVQQPALMVSTSCDVYRYSVLPQIFLFSKAPPLRFTNRLYSLHCNFLI